MALKFVIFCLIEIVIIAAGDNDDDDLGKKTADLKRQALKIMELRGVNASTNDTIQNVPVWGDLQITDDLYESIKNSFDEEQQLLESKDEQDRTTAPDFKLIPLAKWSMPIPFLLNDIKTADLKPKIRDGLNEIHSKVSCISFKELTQAPSNSHINFKEVPTLGPGVCANSPLGRQQKVNTINIATYCQSYGAVIHEVLHSLGFAHTQQRPDADQYIEVKWENMVDDADLRSNFKPWQYALKNQGPFDYGSIMMYPPTAFSKNNKDTLVPKRNPESNRKLMGRLEHLSEEDVNILKKIYCDSDKGERQSCGNKKEETDISEHDLYFVNGKPESNCCELCSSESRCKAYAWNNWEGGTCFLKSATGPTISKSGVKIGILGKATTGAACSNHERSCDWWSSKGYCDEKSIYYAYVTKCCPKSCKKC